MVEPLLKTKFHIPLIQPDPSDSLVLRPSLIEQLNKGLPGKLSLISAPAGFGKTTLVSHWLQQVNLPAAWLSLDEDDNDLARFLNYLIAALQTIRPEVGMSVLAMLHSSALPHSDTLLTLLINDLITISEKFILVLDDYHAIQTYLIDQAIAYFIEHMPPSMHLVITSRVDPNLSLARLRAKGQLTELRGTDLSFTQVETAQFLKKVTGLSLSTAEVAALNRHVEGWVAGLQMAALSLRQREAPDVAQFIEDFTGSHRYIMDYLVDEVLQGQPPEIQTFLLYTSILDQLCGPLCEALFRESEASGSDQDVASPAMFLDARRVQELLVYLEHANLFINPLDDQRHWYRYHQLFADLLRHRLSYTYPDHIATLHLKASQWYEQAGLTGSAVRHSLAAHAFGRAATLVEQVAPAMLQRVELARLLSWLEALPEEEVQARPLLALYYGWDLFLSGQIQRAAARLETVEARLAMDEAKRTPEVQAQVAAMRVCLARETGDFDTTIALSREALADLPERATLLRAMVALNLAVAYYFQGELEPASELLTESIGTGQTAQRASITLYSISLSAQILRAQGRLQQALQLCQEGLERVGRLGWRNFPAAGILYVTLGDLFRERNELTAAAEYLEKGIQLGQEGGIPNILISGHVWLSWLRQTQGDVAGSQVSIRTALQLVQRDQVSRFWPLPPAACYQARLWIAQGNLAAASRWAQASDLNEGYTSTYFYEVDALTLARLLIAQGSLEDAESLLLRLQRAAVAAGRGGSLIEILILQAITFTAQKHGEEALSALAHALHLAKPEGFVRIFLDEGPPMVEILRRAVAQGLHTHYALHLLNALSETVTAPQPLIEPLSERELEVLRRVAAGYSNNQIAQELVVAVSTVKKHISNIYDKLEVESRTQAVARARELGLL
jgi:LuxR family transcriptional regulator, maltose regulon positive regulatory protein